MDWLDYARPLLLGARVTIELTLYSTVLGGVFSFAFGIGRLSGNRLLRWFSIALIEVFRGTSLLVQLFWLFFALPVAGELLGVDLRLSPVVAGTLALSLNIGAYGAEVVRGAIQAVPVTQYEAAKALDFTPRQILWRIAVPQAVPEMMPSFGNLAIQNLKDTALVSLIGLGDLAFQAERIRNFTQDSVSVYTVLLLMYFGMALVLAAIMRMLERRAGRWRAKGT
ncbi:ectoine/hydroxyectoine ABC transporter permease subunit EhuC [Castellaniella sp. S9]|uniref:ectoine/hydroxyectoine ABC transporter permease subunit EhuC n=1 Tax=Castellaniella sp. S9 TaxID=2993652 RepID=UPI0022B30FB9|nr:ectoine/hydroxyectoine ABC transporter permease subunit EhuC [Castellaniella sp. S9]